MRPTRTQILALLGAILVTALLVAATTTTSLSSGVLRPTLKDEGCVCHGPNKATDGKPNANVTLLFQLSPNDMVYKPGRTYNITVGPAGTDVPIKEGSYQGGFNLKVNVGQLGPGEGFDTFVAISGTKLEATHTVDGDLNGREYNLTWKAPPNSDDPAVFTLFVNTVNGDAQNTELDHWNGGTFAVLNKPGVALGGAAHVDPAEIGVKWLAHWVGIVSFLAVVGTLLVYYFVLKYGESVHTTDHRDRKEK